jgi:hypothetical protein
MNTPLTRATLLSLLVACGGDDATIIDAAPARIERSTLRVPGANTMGQVSATVQAAAGDTLALLMYWASTYPIVLDDSAGLTWESNPIEGTSCGAPAGAPGKNLRFYTARVEQAADITINVHQQAVDYPVGFVVAAYTGTDARATLASGRVASGASTTTLTAGTLPLDRPSVVLTGYMEASATPVLGTDATEIARDDSLHFVMAEQAADAGSLSPTATVQGGAASDCWIGVSLALGQAR